MSAPPRRDVSLARALSKLGVASRTVAERMIGEGRVGVNGRIVREPAFRCSLAADRISIDGAPVRARAAATVIAMHKPAGVVTTRSDERGRKTVYDVLGETGKWLFPVGRLDKETSGLLILTDDHRLGERLTNPDSKVPKTYVAGLDREMSERDAERLRRGLTAGGESYLPALVRTRRGSAEVEITIVEGKNRQVRRMCESLGYEVLSLVRTSIGRLTLGTLKPGEVRRLRREDLLLLVPAEK